jgi:tRNA(adenine34) deaminase
MCAGALVVARIQKVYFGLGDTKMGCLGGATHLGQLPESNHKFEAVGGILEKENHALLNAFFEKKRAEKKNRSSEDTSI